MLEAEYVRQQLAAVADPVALLEALFAEAPVAFAVAHIDGRCLVVNRAFIALFGSAPPPDYNVFQDELIAAQGLLTYIERAFRGEAVMVPVFWYDAGEHRAPRQVAIEVSITPLTDAEDRVQHVALWYRDVTAAHQLDDERRLLRTLFEAAPEAILVANATTGRIEDANTRAAELFGYPRAQLLGMRHIDLSPARQPDGRRSVDEIGRHVERAHAGEAVTLDWMYQSAVGDLVPCELRLAHVPAGGSVLCQVTIIDLRARRLAELERDRVRELEDQNRRHHAASRLKSEFLAAMSHELRTPLNAIIGFSELIFYGRVEPGSPEHHEFMGDILTSGRHMVQLMNDVLDLAKIEAGKLEFYPQPMVIEAVIAEVAGLLRTQSLQKRIKVDIEADRSLDLVMLDPARFKQVLYNYLSNALKFTPEGGRIVVRTRREAADAFRVEVEDSGIGIARDQLGRLFLEFEQLGGPLDKPHGTGLGLALTRKLVEAQGGSVGVRSELGRGSVFHAVLPRVLPQTQLAARGA